MMDEQTLAYLAGFLDGEGCFRADINRYCKVLVTCGNTYLPTLELLQKTFGGSIGAIKKRKVHYKQAYQWSVSDKLASNVCQTLAPYLREKAEQALLIIALQQTKGQHRKGKKYNKVSEDIKEERLRLSAKLKELKHE